MGRQGRRRSSAAAARGGPWGGIFLVGCAVHTICVAGILPACAEGVPPSEEPVCTARPTVEQTLATVRDCMTRSPAPWPKEWQSEYVATIREAVAPRRDDPDYPKRLQILREGFGPYWERLRKDGERSLFEVHRAEIRWYVENLMGAQLPSEEEKQRLRDQRRNLIEHAAQGLLTQFSFLDPNVVQKAKADHLTNCYRSLDAPLVPIFLIPFSESQMSQIKQRWHDLRYARIDLWRSLGAHGVTEARDPASARMQVKRPNEHPDYLLTRRSLDQLRGQFWSVIPAPPDYYRDAEAKEIAARKQRLQARTDARNQEQRLGLAVWQTEYLSFLLTALLETAESYQEEAQ